MKKLLRNANILSLLLILAGLALWLSYGLASGRGRAGLALLALGTLALAAYLAVNISRLRTRSARLNFLFASNLTVVVLLVVAVVAAVNVLGSRLYRRFDLTAERAHSLSPQSLQVVQALKRELSVQAFFSKGHGSQARCQALLEIYRYHNRRLRVAFIDPYLKPELVKRYDIKADGTLVFEYDGRSTRTQEVSEEAITNAIISVSRQAEKTVYVVQGHGEPAPGDSGENGFSEAKAGLEKLSFRVRELVLFQEAAVPADAAAVVLPGPQKPLLAKEVMLLENYMAGRGRLLLLLDPDQGGGLEPLLKTFGLTLERNVVVDADPLSQYMGGNYFMPVVAKYGEHAITRGFGYATMFPLARGLGRAAPAPTGVTADVLASTSPNSWGETNYEAEVQTEKITQNPEDKRGPIDIAIAAERTSGEKPARLVVVGDSDFALNKYYFFQANSNFLNNMVSWLAEEKDLVAIAAKTQAPRIVSLTRSAGRLAFFYTLVILPLLVFAAGIAIWLYRRKL